MKKSTRWALIVALVAATGVAMVLAFLLSIATDNRLFYEKHFQWLFWVNLLVAGLLMLVIGIAATRLLVRVQRGKFGSRLLLKLAAIFALVGVLPGVLIYTVSYQFVSRGIESWFDVKVEGALDAGLALGRGTLDAQVNDLASKTQLAADRLGEGRGRHPGPGARTLARRPVGAERGHRQQHGPGAAVGRSLLRVAGARSAVARAAAQCPRWARSGTTGRSRRRQCDHRRTRGCRLGQPESRTGAHPGAGLPAQHRHRADTAGALLDGDDAAAHRAGQQRTRGADGLSRIPAALTGPRGSARDVHRHADADTDSCGVRCAAAGLDAVESDRQAAADAGRRCAAGCARRPGGQAGVRLA